MITVHFITSHLGKLANAFLVIVNGEGYLLNYWINDDGSVRKYLCPCCMFPHQREEISRVIREAYKSGALHSRVRWLNENDASDYGKSVTESDGYDDIFCSGSFDELPEEAMRLLHLEAEKYRKA